LAEQPQSTGPGRSQEDDRFRRLSAIALPRGDDELSAFLRRLGFVVGLILALQIAGTIGFALTEQVSAWQGFLWSVDTIATIGSFDDAETTGGQIVKLVLVMLGVGTLFYALVTTTEFFVAGHLSGLLEERRTLRRIQDFNNHHIICGFGRVGRQVARDLQTNKEPFIVIDPLIENRERAEQMEAPFLLGTPSEDEMLQEAGIERAHTLLACVDSDAENIFICLTARELQPEITIVARAGVSDAEQKLIRAGADRVISPYKTSGAEMARLALNPQVAGVVDVAPEYRMEEIEVAENCEGVGKRIGEVRGEAVIAALRSAGGEVQPQPDQETKLDAGDVLVAMGTVGALRELERQFAPNSGSS
jgi:voltage-gated potassium channel